MNRTSPFRKLALGALAVFAATFPFQLYIPIGSFPLSTAYLWILLIFGGWSAHVLVSPDRRIYWPRPATPLALLIALIWLSLLFAADRAAVLISGVQIAAYFALLIAVANLIRSGAEVRRYLRLILIGFALGALLGIVQAVLGMVMPDRIIEIFFESPLATFVLGGRGIERLNDLNGLTVLRSSSLTSAGDIFRGFGFFTGPTVYGWFVVAGAALGLGIWLAAPRGDGRMRRLARTTAVLASAAVILSWTRSAWLALLAGVVFILIFRRGRYTGLLSKHWWRLGAALVLAVVALVVAGLAMPETAIGQMILTSFGFAEASSNLGRLETVMFALDWLARHPVIGAGFRNYGYISTQGTVFALERATEATAHNTYLELAVELGIFGLLAFLWLLYALFRDARYLMRRPLAEFPHALGLAFAAVWFTFAIVMLFNGSIVEPKWMSTIWMMAGVQSAAVWIVRRQ